MNKKTLSVEEYFKKMKPYLKNVINYLKNLTFNFISSKDDNDEESERHSKIFNIEIIINDEADEVIEELFESIKNNIKIIWKNQWLTVNLSFIMFIDYIINVIKQIQIVVGHI